MQKKLTITIGEDVYLSLHHRIGRRKISRFIEDLVRPQLLDADMETAYRTMAQDEEREREAREWSESTVGDSFHEAR